MKKSLYMNVYRKEGKEENNLLVLNSTKWVEHVKNKKIFYTYILL